MDLREKLESMKEGQVDETIIETPVEEAPQTEFSFDVDDTTEAKIEEPELVEDQIDTALETKEEDELLEELNTEKYVPNFKYKAVGEEFEFDDDIKTLITSKEKEEHFRSLHAKAKGLEFFEEKHKKLEDSHNDLTVEYESKMRSATELANIVNDFNAKVASNNPGEQHRALLEAGMNEQAILNVAKQILDLRELNPQQRQAYDSQFQQRDAIKTYETKLSSQEQQMQQLQVEAAEAQVNAFLVTQNDFVSEYEAMNGRNSGDFRKDFINYGAYLASSGKNPDLNTAMAEFKKLHNLGNKPKAAPVAQEPVELIPNAKGSGHSPIQKEFKSMDDLRAYMWK